MAYISYQDLNSLNEISLIAGTEYTLNYTVYDEDGVNLADLGGATIELAISPFGQTDYCVIQKTGTMTGTGTFTVVLSSADTASLSGKYIQQPIITAFSGAEYRPAQGTIIILPKIVTT
jgi:hypothetical protein